LHIATRGLLDGKFGIATRGYIIFSDVVPLFPDLAHTTVDDSEWAVLTAQDFSAMIRDFPKLSFEATITDTGHYIIQINGAAWDWDAVVTSMDLSAITRSQDDVVGGADVSDMTTAAVSDSDTGVVDAEDETATVDLGDDVIGDTDGTSH
jgi:hypothetical protein